MFNNPFSFSCVRCHSRLYIAHHGLCSRCLKNISIRPHCGRCGSILSQYSLRCGQCLHQAPLWERLVVVGDYTPPLSILIHQFKFQNAFWLDRTLARLLYLAVRNAKRTHQLTLPEAIVPVPLHHRRQWQRGYNQAELLSRQLAKWLNLPLCSDLIQRAKYTHTQRGLTAKSRRHNLKNAFVLSSSAAEVSYRSIALVDDVITTGSTLNEVIKTLRKTDIRHIQVWGLAKT